MARLNTPAVATETTHEGAPAFPHAKPLQRLRRSVLSCLLWEREFYEDGQSIASRVCEAAEAVAPAELMSLAIEARTKFNLRHVPLLLLDVLSRTGPELTAEAVGRVVQRADEMAELLAVHWRDGRKPVPRQMRKGIAAAFAKFDEHQLAKYDRDGAIKLRDVLRIARPKPSSPEQSALWKRVKDRTLATPDTWEVALSAGADKRETFERLLREGNLGYLALLRNLRNMAQAQVDPGLVRDAILARRNGAHKVLPFRFVAAARAAPQYERELDAVLCATVDEMNVIHGETIVLVDVSGSMEERLSQKSDLRRFDAAAALAAIFPGSVRVFSFSENLVEVPPRRGMAGVDAILNSQAWGGTYLGTAVAKINGLPHDRLIVITDEQSHDPVPAPARRGYMINVASARNGVGYGPWVHIDGFSEQVLNFIAETERELEEREER